MIATTARLAAIEDAARDVSRMLPLRIENGDSTVLGPGKLDAASPARQLTLKPTNDANSFSVAEPGRETSVKARTDHIAYENDLDRQQDPSPVFCGKRGRAVDLLP
ncbi:hypothetical protein Raf01_95290 [Rugosimonospora africana]|uniref:Uncharacterized protein n=1 Tax=Rugosimonospora africana TaxID=556532 RepID=A0A8J3VW44_9ACTN|nr:hypothetical protein Raf01_95290 [Rugosimonospora africana]